MFTEYFKYAPSVAGSVHSNLSNSITIQWNEEYYILYNSIVIVYDYAP